MATYKKNNNRPNRNRNTEQLDEAQEAQLHQESTTAEVFDALDAGANRTEDWVKRNQKIIIGFLIAIAVVGLGYLLYQQFVKAPNEKKAANLAEYGMGMAYMRLRDYNNAINHLKKFNSDDDIFGALAYGNIGDAYLQQKNNAEALKYYIKAFEHSNNDFVTPIYLKKAGIVASLQGKKDDALKYYERIKDEFPTSEEARTIDILIGKISQ